MQFTPEDYTILERLADKYLPWEEPQDRLSDLNALALRVMNDAEEFWETREFRRIVGDTFIRQVLLSNPAVLFSSGAWGYWHNRIGLPVRPIPRRSEGIHRRILRDY